MLAVFFCGTWNAEAGYTCFSHNFEDNMPSLTAHVKQQVQPPSLAGKVLEALKQLNYDYGYGDVHEARVFLDGRIEFEVRGFGPSKMRTGRLVNGTTVKALGRQKTINLHEDVKVSGLTYAALQAIWEKQKPDTRLPRGRNGQPEVWKTCELKEGYVLFTRPGRVVQLLGFMTVAEDGVVYRFQKDGLWIGKLCAVPIKEFEEDGAVLLY